MFTLHSYLTTFIFIDYAVGMFRHEGCSLSETTLQILLWALYGVFYACVFFFLPCSMAWVCSRFPDLFMTLSNPMKDDWDGGFWHREDIEAMGTVKGQANSTLTSFQIDPRELTIKTENHHKSTPRSRVYSDRNEMTLWPSVTLTPLYELKAKGKFRSEYATDGAMADQVSFQGFLREPKSPNKIDCAVCQGKIMEKYTDSEVQIMLLQHLGKELLKAHPEVPSVRMTLTFTRPAKVDKEMGKVGEAHKADGAQV
ncbi:MAG: hypothetical protein Q9201_005135 [Fulgogasparrea decipioides]